jgi:hypothetical protein
LVGSGRGLLIDRLTGHFIHTETLGTCIRRQGIKYGWLVNFHYLRRKKKNNRAAPPRIKGR